MNAIVWRLDCLECGLLRIGSPESGECPRCGCGSFGVSDMGRPEERRPQERDAAAREARWVAAVGGQMVMAL